MPEIRYTDTFDAQGNLIGHEPYEVSDEELAQEQAFARIIELLDKSTHTKLELTELLQKVLIRGGYEVSPTQQVPLSSSHWATIDSFTPGAQKPMTVTRNWQGNNVTLDCYVTESVKDLYQGGQLNVGDFVIVEFIDEHVDKPLVIAKVFKSW